MLSYGGGPRSGKYWIRRNFAEKWSPGQIQGAGTLARRPGSGNGPVCTSLNARSGPGAFHTLEWPRPARAANSGSCYISRKMNLRGNYEIANNTESAWQWVRDTGTTLQVTTTVSVVSMFLVAACSWLNLWIHCSDPLFRTVSGFVLRKTKRKHKTTRENKSRDRELFNGTGLTSVLPIAFENGRFEVDNYLCGSS